VSKTPEVTRSLLNAPLPRVIERLGASIAQAQAELDGNSIAIAREMASTEVEFGDGDYTLLSLGFTPSFYAFTEALVEAKLSFSMAETRQTGVEAGAEGGVVGGIGFFSASVDVSYARKFSVSSEGTSSISARLVSLPPPEAFTEVLRRNMDSENE